MGEPIEQSVQPKTYLSQAEQDGLVEIVNPDGSISQVTKDAAQKMIDNLEQLKAKANL
jgi:hypothetical protein